MSIHVPRSGPSVRLSVDLDIEAMENVTSIIQAASKALTTLH